ncbi:hypothetical protein HOLleu_20901 [Holothuria leucospilota]|uniref:Helix-turn-helix domain-containing protein n=1 Tax=Holothuria leucospilota TaxID=206669 RepID=A0A9Q1BWZ4_HOLLE|nr:hypothetical protein HOLleu_20901 [Holothuria leucospilota]
MPYMKQNNTSLYVHRESNHPPSIIKNIPKAVNRRLSTISSNDAVFDAAAPPYQEALTKSGYQHQLRYEPPSRNNNNEKRKRKRNITWFNPPYSANVATNVGKKFLNLLEKCFPPGHQLRKILNRNTVKISYSCMPNVHQIITSHNKSILRAEKTADRARNTRSCNCRKDNPCPLEGNCLASGIIYQALVTRQDTL